MDEDQNYHQEEFEPYEEMGQVMPDDYTQENRVGAEYQSKRDRKALRKLECEQYSIHTLHM